MTISNTSLTNITNNHIKKKETMRKMKLISVNRIKDHHHIKKEKEVKEEVEVEDMAKILRRPTHNLILIMILIVKVIFSKI